LSQIEKPSVQPPFNWTETLKALADETRLLIIQELLKHDVSVTELSEILDIEIYNISRHLKILEASGLLEGKKKGRKKIYSVTESIKSRFSDKEQVLDLGCCKFAFKNNFVLHRKRSTDLPCLK